MQQAFFHAGIWGKTVYNTLAASKFIEISQWVLTAKQSSELITRIFFTTLAVLKTLLFSTLCIATVPLNPLFPKRYSDLMDYTQKSVQEIVDSAYRNKTKGDTIRPQSWAKSLLSGLTHPRLISPKAMRQVYSAISGALAAAFVGRFYLFYAGCRCP